MQEDANIQYKIAELQKYLIATRMSNTNLEANLKCLIGDSEWSSKEISFQKLYYDLE